MISASHRKRDSREALVRWLRDGLREAELPTPALLIVDFQFSIACPSLDFQSKVASRNRRKYWLGIFFSVSASLERDPV